MAFAIHAEIKDPQSSTALPLKVFPFTLLAAVEAGSGGYIWLDCYNPPLPDILRVRYVVTIVIRHYFIATNFL